MIVFKVSRSLCWKPYVSYQFWFRRSQDNYWKTRLAHFWQSWNFGGNSFYVWCNSDHFECRRFPILKWAHIQANSEKPMSLSCLVLEYGSPNEILIKIQNGCHDGHIGFSMNMKMTQNQFVPNIMQIQPFWKITNYAITT